MPMLVLAISYMKLCNSYISRAADAGPQGHSPAADPCREETRAAALPSAGANDQLRLGWCRYKSGDFRAAEKRFDAALEREPSSVPATVGKGYAAMQLGRIAEARAAFRKALASDPADRDARKGLSLAALRAPAEELRLDPDADPSLDLAVPARALRDFLEVRVDGEYRPLFVKGVNLGAALPGKYPTEFPLDESVYSGWLDTIADLGANAVRLYTLLPPEFYRALAAHNARPGARRLWLIQGAWAELPDGNDFSNPDYVEELDAEIARVIDAVHGDVVLPPRPGHAAGIYDTDASASLLGVLVGREWEPYAVKAFDTSHPLGSYDGTYFKVESAPAMEQWVARECDTAAKYEAKRYRTLHPLSFANWPTLDPLRHDTEANRNEEDAWRARYGIPFPEAFREAPWENDAVSLDATKIAPTPAMPAGFFASYHIYPNYPDFLNLEPAYGAEATSTGTSRYAAYLRALKRYHGHQPLLVAEYGISTSRGVAHVQPEGWDHGGHDERRQGALIAQMTSALHDAGYAGGVLFEFMDEWFKGTWSRASLELPAERRRLWFDAESPEQSYGVVANRPSTPVRVDGDPSDWPDAPYMRAPSRSKGTGWNALREVRVTSDEGYLYLLLRTAGGPSSPDWSTTGFRIAIDTYDASRGATRLPAPGEATTETGVEFLIDLRGPQASNATVVAPYEPYAAIESGPVASPPVSKHDAPAFVPMTFEANRERIGRDGTRYPSIRVDRGALRFGSLDPQAPAFDTRTDVAVGATTGTIEMRLPWGLLNVTDPSSRRVLHQTTTHEAPLDTIETVGFRIYVFAIDPSDPARKPLSRLPASGSSPPLYAWAAWETPHYRTERKSSFDAIRAAWSRIADRPALPPVTPGGTHAP